MADQANRNPLEPTRPNLWLRLLLVGSAALLLLLLGPAVARAAIFTVDSADDVVNPTTDGLCNTAVGCTLREAIREANATPEFDEIILPEGTYTLTIPGAGEDNSLTGDLDITDSVSIQGAGPDLTIIRAGTDSSNGIDRVFHINPTFDRAFDTTISGVTIRYGRTTAADGAGMGGGLAWSGVYPDAGSITIENSVISDNQAVNSSGGGLFFVNGTAAIYDTTIANNSAKVSGGGIYLYGTTTTIHYATISGNRTTTATPAEGGGGVASQESPTVSIANSTISGNSSASEGGGLWVNVGTVALTNVTITQNQSETAGGGIYTRGGTSTITNTIVAQNYLVAATTTANDVGGLALAATSSYNLIGSGGSGGLVHGANGNQVGVADPGLGALANNGGPTRTHALLAGSPAIDAGDSTGLTGTDTDQRGGGRLADHIGDADTDAEVDIGAYEAHPSIENIEDKSISGATSFLFSFADPVAGITAITATSDNTAVIPNDAAHLSITAGTEDRKRSLNLTPAAAGSATITVTVSDDLGSASDTFLVTATLQPGLLIEQTDNGPFIQGESGSYSITVTNGGTAPTDGSAVTVTGSLSAGLTATGIAGDGWNCVLATLTCTRSNALAVGMAYPAITLTVSVATDASSPVSSTATVSGGGDVVGDTVTTESTVLPKALTPSVTGATTAEDTQSASGLVITAGAGETAPVTHFRITAITGGRLYKSDGSTEITNGVFITVAEGGAGLRFTPSANQNTAAGGSFSFAVHAALSDTGAGLSAAAATATITVTAVNDPPTADNESLAAVAEDAAEFAIPVADLLAGDTPGGPADEAGQSLTVTAVTAATGGTVTLSGGNVQFTPAADFNGTATFTYTVQDDGTTNGAADPKTATGTVSFTVTAVNDPPVAAADTLAAVPEDSAPFTVTAATLLANDSAGPADESGQSLTLLSVTGATGGTVSLAGTVVTFTPAADFSGTAGFSYTVGDNGTTNGAADPKSGTGSVTFTVTPTAEPPTVTPATTPEDTQSTAGLVISRTAPDGAEVTHFKITAITGGRLYKSNGSTEIANGMFITVAEGETGLRFTPAAEKSSPAGDSFSFVAQAALDAAGTGLSGPTTATITVTEVNDPPVAAADTLAAVPEDSAPFTVTAAALLANDSNGAANESGQSLTILSVGGATGGTVSLAGTVITFTPAANFNGTASFSYTVQDDGTTSGVPEFKTATAAVSLTVTPVNDPPVAAADSLPEAAEDAAPFTVPAAALLANDSPGPGEADQTLTLLSVSDATGGTVSLESGVISFTPAPNYNGPAGFRYTVGDNGTTNGSADPKEQTGTATFTITPVNDLPVALNGTLEAVEGTSKSGTLVGQDLDGDSLTYSIAVAPTLGTVQITDAAAGAFTYRPTRTGTDSFSFQVSDGNGTSNLATVSITVSSPPIRPAPPLEVAPPPALTREATVTISGRTDPYVLVRVGSRSVRAGADGRFQAVIPLVEGTNLILVSVENRPAESFVVVRDSTPPSLRLTASVTSTEGETAVLTAITEAGAAVVIEGQPGSPLTVHLAPGENRFTAVATDRAGNQSADSVLVVRLLPRQSTIVVQPGKPGVVATNQLRIDLPVGTSSRPLHLSVRTGGFEEEAAPPRLPTVAAVVAEVEARLDDGTSVHALGAAVRLIFTYDPALVRNPKDLAVYWYDPAREAWVLAGGVVDEQAHTITVLIDHFTWFAVMAKQGEEPGPGSPPETPPVTPPGTPSDPAAPGTPAVGFTDLNGHWATEAIGAMARLGVVKGYEDASFRPEQPVTRLEFAVMIARLLKLDPAGGELPLTDAAQVPAWAGGELAAAVRAGIVRGRADGSFAPGEPVTRAEVAVMLIRALEFRGQWLPEGEAAFADRAEIPAWALRQIATAVRIYLVTGYEDTTFRPAGQTTRAEAATMLNRLLKALSQ